VDRRRGPEAASEIGLELAPALKAYGEGLLVRLAAGELVE
jgi:hypothetical protein